MRQGALQQLRPVFEGTWCSHKMANSIVHELADTHLDPPALLRVLAGDVVSLGDGRMADGSVRSFYLKEGQTVSCLWAVATNGGMHAERGG
jgi:hypothetical protein